MPRHFSLLPVSSLLLVYLNSSYSIYIHFASPSPHLQCSLLPFYSLPLPYFTPSILQFLFLELFLPFILSWLSFISSFHFYLLLSPPPLPFDHIPLLLYPTPYSLDISFFFPIILRYLFFLPSSFPFFSPPFNFLLPAFAPLHSRLPSLSAMHHSCLYWPITPTFSLHTSRREGRRPLNPLLPPFLWPPYVR